MGEMMILEEPIKYKDRELPIDSLKFYKDNPRVYEHTRAEPDFDNKLEEQQQDIIYEALKVQPSVIELIPEIKRHDGLSEPILVRHDTMEVIEGNSRLAAYRLLYYEEDQDSKWKKILCRVVASLTEEQQAAYLHQIHVKGKSKWSAYEKANLTYVRHVEKGWDPKTIAKIFGEYVPTINKRIEVIKMMKDKRDTDQSHFSHYNVLVNNPDLMDAIKRDKKLHDRVLSDIRKVKDGNGIKAMSLRDHLPVVMKKKKILRRYKDGDISLEDAYQAARINDLAIKVRQANDLLQSIDDSQAILNLEKKEFDVFNYSVQQLRRTVKRLNDVISKYESE